MSLINDALNRARAEAASKEAAERGEIPAVEGPGAEAEHRRPAWALVSVGVAIVLVLALLARREPSAVEPPSEPMAQAPAGEPVQPAEQQPVAPAPAEDTAPARQSTPSTEALATNDRPSSETPARTPPAKAPEAEAAEPELAQTSGTNPDRLPTARAAAPQTTDRTSDAQASETLKEIRVDATPVAETAPESRSPSAPAVRPTTIWPADGPDQETWYFVGKVELAGGGEIELSGIAWSEFTPSAMLNGSLLTVGSEILGLRIISIAPRTVTLAGQGQRIALQLGSTAD